MRYRWITILFALIHIAVFAQDPIWHDRIDSSVIQVLRVRSKLTVTPIQSTDLRRTASPLGEADPVKYIQTLPGVSTGMEGSSAFYVRGGNGGNNLTTLDGVPIYGTGHLLGLTTAYPFEIIERSDFYAGGFPSDVGGFTSSLLRLKSISGDYQTAKSSVFANNFLVGALVSNPLKKNCSSLLTSFRISPFGLEYNLIRPQFKTGLSLPDQINTKAGDMFIKASWKIGDHDNVFLSLFGSIDQYGYNPDKSSSQSLGWSNVIANLAWERVTAFGWKMEVRLSHNGFRAVQNQQHVIKPKTTRMALQSSLTEEGLQAMVSKQVSPKLNIQSGADGFVSFFMPGVSKVYNRKKLIATAGRSLTTVRGSMHGLFNYSNGPFRTTAGFRATVFGAGDHMICNPSSDLLVSYDLSPVISIKATYDHTIQYFHSLEGIPTGWSMEMLIPSNMKNKPELADQAWVGFDYSSGSLYISGGGFYKQMKNLVFYSDASSFFNSNWREWQSNLESGTGRSFGLEVISRIETNRLNGQLSYTLSHTDRVFSSMNDGRPFPFKFDRRHIINLTGEYKFSKSQSLTAGLSYMSGHWETVKSGSYYVYSLGSEDRRETAEADYTSHPNNFHLHAYFRMDCGYHLTIGKKRNQNLSFGIYNLTNRHNTYSLSWDSEESKWKKLSIFPIMPNFTYRVNF